MRIRLLVLSLLLAGAIVYVSLEHEESVSHYWQSAQVIIKKQYLQLFPYKDKYFVYIRSSEQWQLINWLDKKDFNALDNYFTSHVGDFRNNIKYESRLHSSYSVFGFIDNISIENLNDWVEVNPKSIHAVIARAYYFEKLAWKKRGSKFMSKTSPEQVTDMRKYMLKAISDAEAAIKIAYDITTPYTVLMNAHGAMGQDGLHYYAYKRGIERIPGSFILRSVSLAYLEPKWGGSQAKMRAFAYKEIKNVDINPGLIRLKSKYAIYKAGLARPKCGTKAMAIYENILKYDRYWRVFLLRAHCLNKKGLHGLAIEETSEALMRMPDDYGLLLQRAQAYKKLKKYDLAENDLLFLVDQYPEKYKGSSEYAELLRLTGRMDEAILFTTQKINTVKKYKSYWMAKRGWYYSKKRLYKKALNDFEQSINLREKNGWAWSNIGLIYQHHLKDVEKAIAAYRKAYQYRKTSLYAINLAGVLYESKNKEAPDAYREYLKRCEKEKCSDAGVKWSTGFLACINKEKTCRFDGHDYEHWL